MSSRASLNHLFRTVWNASLGVMVAVPEHASSQGGSGAGQGSRGSGSSLVANLSPLALAIALGWSVAPGAHANPQGGVAIHGQASMTTQGSQLLVTTQNGAGSSHSAINWQSFSIPAGSSTRIEQPHAASMSINRVITSTPSLLFGSLSSNGKVVLVNQSGIAVGSGALVDTAGFTASVVGMSEFDAVLGRLRFGGEGFANTGGALTVQGNIISRGGDVVLIAPDMELAKTAVVEAQGGSVVLAAGQSVEVTGRGLEGITLQVQAPAHQAINLGTLKGDAVGIFAGTLRHSGLIQANQAALDGGRVVLKAAGDAYVEGSGSISATSGNGKGGSVEVLGNRVALLDHAQIDVSGASGGGTVLVGGDYQGKNPEIKNAAITFVGPDTRIAANATGSGSGGRVIVWADDTTRAYGGISARGGSTSGDGGFVETSGKRFLDVGHAYPDLRAPMGLPGTWLLDPDSIDITNASSLITPGSPFTPNPAGSVSTLDAGTLATALGSGPAVVTTVSGDITVSSPVGWSSTNGLTLTAGGTVNVNAAVNGGTTADLTLSGVALINTGLVGNLTGKNITLTGPSGVSIGSNITAAGTLGITANGTGASVTQGISSSGGITATGATTVSAGSGGVTLNFASNNFSSISATATGGAVTLKDTNALVLNAVSGTNVTITTGGALTQSAGIVATSGTLNTTTVGGTTLNNANNVRSLIASNTGSGNFAFKNTGTLGLTVNSTTGGSIKVETSGNLTLNAGITSSQATGDAVVLATGGNFLNSGGHNLSLSGTGSPRWLIYSTNPSGNTLGASQTSGYAFQQYNATYGVTPVQGSGNGLLYSFAPPALTGTLTGAVSKVFDGGTSANLTSATLTMSGGPNSCLSTCATALDSLTVTNKGTGAFANPNVGTGKAVTTTGFSVTGLDSSSTPKPVYGYTLPASVTGNIGTITPAPIVVTPVAPPPTSVSASLTGVASKTYDGTNIATLIPSNFSLSGFVSTDSVIVTKTTGTYASKNVGNLIPVSTTLAANDFSPVGATNLSNYSLPTSASGNIGNITPASIAVNGIFALNKIYDGTFVASLNTSAAVLSGLISGDSVGFTATSASFLDKNVGTAKSVTVSGLSLTGADAGNYTLATVGNNIASANITRANITGITGIEAASKVYDGTTNATLKSDAAALAGLVSGDAVAVTGGSGSFSDKNVGKAKPVTVTGLALIGADAGNYTLVATGSSATADITQASISAITGIQAASRVYDGTTLATLNTSAAVLSGLMGDDKVAVSGGSGNFGDKNVGTAKPVRVAGITLTGADAGNYSAPDVVTQADITVRANSTWTGAVNNLWSHPGNWDALPDGANVLAVSIPSGAGQVVFDSGVGNTALQTLTSGRTLVMASGALQIASNLSSTGFVQSAGAVVGSGLFQVNGSFNQTGGSIAMAAIDIMQTSGPLEFSGLNAPTVTLTAQNGAILQSGGIVSSALTTTSTGGTLLNHPANRIASWSASNQGLGAIELTNVGAIDILGINNSGGNIEVVNTGGIVTKGDVTAPAGTVTLTSNSPLTVGKDGLSATGNIVLRASNLTSAGNMTLDGPVISRAGSVQLSAANNLVQNSTVHGALGVKVDVGGNLILGPLATAGAQPVTYLTGGTPVSPPPPPGGRSDQILNNMVAAFLNSFETTLEPRPGAKFGNSDKSEGSKKHSDLVVEGEVCRP